jgi:hypothetical protein
MQQTAKTPQLNFYQQMYIRYYETHTLAGLCKSAILVQSQKADIFQVGKRNIQNHKTIDKWDNAKVALPLAY